MNVFMHNYTRRLWAVCMSVEGLVWSWQKASNLHGLIRFHHSVSISPPFLQRCMCTCLIAPLYLRLVWSVFLPLSFCLPFLCLLSVSPLGFIFSVIPVLFFTPLPSSSSLILTSFAFLPLVWTGYLTWLIYLDLDPGLTQVWYRIHTDTHITSIILTGLITSATLFHG